MRKILLLAIIIGWNFLQAQKIGFIEAYDTKIKMKYVHIENAWSANIVCVQELDYSIKPFINSFFMKEKISPTMLEDFDVSWLDYWNPRYRNRGIEKKLKTYCEEKGLDAVIIIKSNNVYSTLDSVRKNLIYTSDYGLLTYGWAKNNVFYYSNLFLLYYTVKEDKLLYPVRNNKEDMLYNHYRNIKLDTAVFDKGSKQLTNSEEVKDYFIKDYEMRIELNFKDVIDKIKEGNFN